MAILYGAVKEGAVEAHNFADELSLKTTRTNNRIVEWQADCKRTLAWSVYSIETPDHPGSDEESEEEETEGTVRIEEMDIVGEKDQAKTTRKPHNNHYSVSSQRGRDKDFICNRTSKLQVQDKNDEGRVSKKARRITKTGRTGRQTETV